MTSGDGLSERQASEASDKPALCASERTPGDTRSDDLERKSQSPTVRARMKIRAVNVRGIQMAGN